MRTEVPVFAAMPCAMARSSPLVASSHCLPQGSRLRRLSRTAGRLQQGFVPSEMGFRISLRGISPEPPMSALGHKRTFRSFRPMSALPPKADIGAGSNHLRRSSSGSLAIFAAIRRASSFVSNFAAEREFGTAKMKFPQCCHRRCQHLISGYRFL